MIYTVSEVSDVTRLSKESIYSIFKLKEIEPYLTKNQGVVYITEEGLKTILSDLKENIEYLNPLKDEVPDNINKNKEDLGFKEDYITTLKQQLEVKDIQILENTSQLKEKDIQIHELNNRLSQEQNLHKNTQILFKQQQPKQDILTLEEHFLNMDTKIEEVRENMIQRKEQQHKSIFSKIAKK